VYQLVDFQSRSTVQPDSFVFSGGDRPWEVVMDIDRIRSGIHLDYFRRTPSTVSKYFPFFPLKDIHNFVSMNEGATPLVRSKSIGPALGIDLYFKQESRNPTGSFKDRGSAIEISLARELGVKGITVASTGNMAASCSCYAAAARIPCFVFVPEDTPSSKLSQSISYGGRIVQVKGSYDDAARLAEEVARELDFYLAGDYAFRVEGQKTAVYEIIDQFFYESPELIFVPIGCGTNITAYAKGLAEYKQLGLITRLPKLVGTQAEGARSVVNAFHKGLQHVEKLDSLDTLSSAIAVKQPLDGVKALDAIYRTEGSAIAVSDRETLEAQYQLSRDEGLYVEASSATSVASFLKMVREGARPQGPVVCVLTGDGLKDPSPMLRIALKPPTIYPEVTEFISLFRSSFFEGKTVAFVERGEVLFSHVPTPGEVTKLIQQHFSAEYPKDYSSRIVTVIEKFLKKGKLVTFSDFQDIVQTVHKEELESGDGLKVLDWEVVTGLDRQPKAKVGVKLGDQIHEASASGVGPVDAVVNALCAACGEKLQCALENFSVVIRSSGTDAVVVAEMKLAWEGIRSVGKGTSPDVIQASLEAFEDAYNDILRRSSIAA
jgi:threonine synthase